MLAVSKLKTPGLHFVGGVSGLALNVTSTGARSWILRATVGTARREIGIGSCSNVPLAMARERAREARQAIERGLDPVAERRAARSARSATAAAAWTFDQCVQGFLKDNSRKWSNPKHAAQWEATLTTYASPTLGKLLVQDIDVPHVLAVLRPIWETKTETASRMRGRIEAVLSWATVSKYRKGDNPARWKGNLSAILPAPGDVASVTHHEALPVRDVGAFMVKLREQAGMGARALEFAILTAARSGEVRGAKWAEFDLAAAVWTVPAARMKAGKEHRVPLPEPALTLLQALPRIDDGELVFPAPRGGQLSDMTLSAVLRRMGVAAVPHGFRSTFRDWCSEHTNYPRDVAEMALAHAIGDKVEAAYRRGDLFDKRRQMMGDWAAFLGTSAPEA